MSEMGLVEHCNTAVPQSRGWLFSNNRFTESYDQLGACLGSGGMGRVWAARASTASSSSSSSGPGRPAGSWVAVKAIPMELAEDDFSSGNLQNGLRECLSTFRDLSPVHVVRYDSYWMEEQEHLPLEMRRFWEPGLDLAPPLTLPIPALALAEEAPSEEAEGECANSQRTAASEVSPRFAEDLPNRCLVPDEGHYRGPRQRAASLTPATPTRHDASRASIFSDSCGFVFEASATPATSSMALPTPTGGSDAPTRRCEDRAVPLPPERRAPAASGTAKGPTRVVLLIEMELMGAVPGRAEKNDGEERLTLRAWLQRCGPPCRTFRHAADVFGMLMLSVRHIHRKRIVHADLKPDNIFLVADRLSKVIAVRIGDFGLAGENQQFRQFKQSDDPRMWILKKSLPAGGTPGYLAPELLSQESPCSDKADIFACAVILLEVLLPPFRTHMERTTFLDGFRIRNAVPEFLEVRLPKTRALLKDMGAEDPACRISAEEVCKKFEKEVRKELCRLSIQRCSSPSVFLNVDPGRRRLDSGDQDRDVDNKRQAAKGKRRGKQNGRRQRAAKGGKVEEPDS